MTLRHLNNRIRMLSAGTEYIGFGQDPLFRAEHGWQQVGGDFTIPDFAKGKQELKIEKETEP